jgi:hypothetical protein
MLKVFDKSTFVGYGAVCFAKHSSFFCKAVNDVLLFKEDIIEINLFLIYLLEFVYMIRQIVRKLFVLDLEKQVKVKN